MSHELIIRSGTVVDGTGRDGYLADVAVDGDRITAIGDLAGEVSATEIDAAGHVVSPGFIDMHTHLDAQVAWDPLLTSSSWHGVTTVLIGNCGVTFAPVAQADQAYLAEMMESVEDISREAILHGLPWDWTTYPQYLESVQRLRPALNMVGFVGHSAVRYHVMGERSLGDEPPTADELTRMREAVAEAIAGGAVGFSASRTPLHTVPDGRAIPGTFAGIDEYRAIARGIRDGGGGIFQSVNDFLNQPELEQTLLETMLADVGSILFSAGVGNDDSARLELLAAFVERTRGADGTVTLAAPTRSGGTLCGLAQVLPVRGRRWRALLDLPTIGDRVEALSDAATRAELIAEGKKNGLWYDPSHIYPLGSGEEPDYCESGGMSVADLATAQGVHPIELIVERLLASEGRELFNAWLFNRRHDLTPDLLAIDRVYPGLSDTGAHAGQICDADMPTHFLTYWHRDRKQFSLAEAVRRLTSFPAGVLRLADRGTLAVGSYADINVFDVQRLASRYPEFAYDFPNGAGRFKLGSRGYAATLVNGQVVAEEGVNTGARPGRVIREFAR